MLADAKRFGDSFSGGELNLVALPVTKGERENFIALLLRDRQARCRVETAAQQNNGTFHLPAGG